MFRHLTERPIRLPRLRPYVPNPNDPAIFWFNSERKDITRDVIERVTTTQSEETSNLELVLNDTALREIRRLALQNDERSRQPLSRYRRLLHRIARMTDEEKVKLLRAETTLMVEDIAGNFDMRVYHFVCQIVPHLLPSLMKPSRVPTALGRHGTESLDALLSIEGDLEILQKLGEKGTLVYVPTHCSNLDSVALAYALHRSGLPPVVYGAGKNLFSNPILSFFMHNLGAYRVDRRIEASLYKNVLKTYSGVLVERGYHSLFFPGGTRSRSGAVENRLKLGFLGSAVEAFSRNQVRGVDRKVFFVPTTINYELVLEAETLIADWLTEEGQSRYIIEDDEFSRAERWFAFFRKLADSPGACVVRFGTPIDPFGNVVDDSGASLSPSGSRMNPGSYVTSQGRPRIDRDRDAAYTHDLGDVLVRTYTKETVLMATHLVAHTLYRKLVRHTEGLDLFARLRVRGEVTMARTEAIEELGVLRDALKSLEEEGALRLSEFVRDEPPAHILERALNLLQGYHRCPAAVDLGAEISAEEPSLLLYYQNRLAPFATRVAPRSYARAAEVICSTEMRR
ncbi:MAG: 1-acyl-sn-glycerol-3-phosphate acyltransferase [Myxococcota bacterium]